MRYADENVNITHAQVYIYTYTIGSRTRLYILYIYIWYNMRASKRKFIRAKRTSPVCGVCGAYSYTRRAVGQMSVFLRSNNDIILYCVGCEENKRVQAKKKKKKSLVNRNREATILSKFVQNKNGQSLRQVAAITIIQIDWPFYQELCRKIIEKKSNILNNEFQSRQNATFALIITPKTMQPR